MPQNLFAQILKIMRILQDVILHSSKVLKFCVNAIMLQKNLCCRMIIVAKVIYERLSGHIMNYKNGLFHPLFTVNRALHK